jgi:hypothetical protein
MKSRSIAPWLLVIALPPAWAQSNIWRDASIRSFALATATTAAVVEGCTQQGLPKGTPVKAEYEKIRADHLELFLEIEPTKEFGEYLDKMRQRVSTARPGEMEEACASMPRMLARLAEQAATVRQIPK